VGNAVTDSPIAVFRGAPGPRANRAPGWSATPLYRSRSARPTTEGARDGVRPDRGRDWKCRFDRITRRVPRLDAPPLTWARRLGSYSSARSHGRIRRSSTAAGKRRDAYAPRHRHRLGCAAAGHVLADGAERGPDEARSRSANSRGYHLRARQLRKSEEHLQLWRPCRPT